MTHYSTDEIDTLFMGAAGRARNNTTPKISPFDQLEIDRRNMQLLGEISNSLQDVRALLQDLINQGLNR